MHVLSIAEELQKLGHDVRMLIPDSLETLQRHRATTVEVKLYSDALGKNLLFNETHNPDLIHAWTPREHVRSVALELSEKYDCPYLLHMEDNEEQIISDEINGLTFSEYKNLPASIVDLVSSPYRMHPHHYDQFVSGAIGYTCLIDRLLEFKPKEVKGLVFWPGFDNEFEFLPSDARSNRNKYGLDDDEIVVFYSGNVHTSIASDITNLYLAVMLFRSQGVKIRLLRTGWNFADLNLPNDPLVKQTVLDLGFVDRIDVPSLLGMSDILVQPGRNDLFNDYRFPSKLTEYLISGKPVILANSNIANALTHNENCLKLTKGTLEELIASISRIIDNQKLAEKLGAGSRKFALKELRWSGAAKKLDTFYQNLIRIKNPQKNKQKTECLDNSVTIAKDLPVKAIAFYLPQYHPITENDEWWGKGFTEWTNVTRAKSQFSGHLQPKLPTDLGFYDLRLPEVMHQQAKMATNYGINGFCFYYYWFDGRRLLEKPLDLWLNKGPEFEFCICWANENWSRRWDGSESDILMEQTYQVGFEEQFIDDIALILKDPRYIKVNGAPLLPIYRISEFKDPVGSAQAMRRHAAKLGIPNLHLAMVQSFGLSDPTPYGLDSAIEFSPPHVNRLLIDPNVMEGNAAGFEGYMEDYVGVASQSINASPTDYVRYRGCFPRWDNTARRKNKGHVLINDSPKAYGQWLRFLTHEAMLRRNQVKPMIFINAWNEWAEGAYLEPDENYGHDFLKITSVAIQNGIADYIEKTPNPEREKAFLNAVSKLPKVRGK